jgi:hypothetical protein
MNELNKMRELLQQHGSNTKAIAEHFAKFYISTRIDAGINKSQIPNEDEAKARAIQLYHHGLINGWLDSSKPLTIENVELSKHTNHSDNFKKAAHMKYAARDFQEVVDLSDLLLRHRPTSSSKESKRYKIWSSLAANIVITYSRPFTKSAGRLEEPQLRDTMKEITPDEPEQLFLHHYIMYLRHKYYAHTDSLGSSLELFRLDGRDLNFMTLKPAEFDDTKILPLISLATHLKTKAEAKFNEYLKKDGTGVSDATHPTADH